MKKNKEERSIGKGNAAVKQWLGNPRRFADLFNGIVFQGKQVILPEDLHLATGETDILVSDKNKKAKEVQRYRDIIMRWEQGAYPAEREASCKKLMTSSMSSRSAVLKSGGKEQKYDYGAIGM